MTGALLSLVGLRKRFGGLAVTDDVSLDIAPAEIHAVIGPNGAGKTTLINEISGVLPVDAGRILFGGRDITGLSMPQRARLGLARSFQITSVVNAFTALENTALAVQARSGSSFRFFRPAGTEAALNRAAMAALDQVGLAARAGTPAGAMSHGEKRQLELAIALATEPRLLLLDEPLAGAGPEETERLIGILRGLKSRYTIVLVEHDMQAVFALADRISVLVYGRVIATGAPDAIRGNAEVRAAYLGEDDTAGAEPVPC
jgi:branched-chain amino acid transport system ATP-binding protein